jgi:U2-associated protein SR140
MLTSRHKQQLEGYLERAAHDPSAIHNAVQLALNRADAAPMIVDMITAALVDGRADTDSKHARLELLSALLHASGSQVPNAWKLRAEIEKQLPTVYDHLGELYRAIHTRIKAEQFKRQFTQVLFQWQQYSVYPQSFLDSLYDKFKRTEVQSPAKVTTRPAKHPLLSTAALEKIHATSSVVDEDLDGEPLEDLDGEPL